MSEEKIIKFDKLIFNETDGAGIHPDFRFLYQTKDKLVTVSRNTDDPSRDLLSIDTSQFSISGYKEEFCLLIKPRFPLFIYYTSSYDYSKAVTINDRGICSFFKKLLTERGCL